MTTSEPSGVAPVFRLCKRETVDDYPDRREMGRSYGPVHGWFELSYAHYLTVPRSVLQAMPLEWQERFVKCLEEMDDTIDWRPKKWQYWVTLREGGKWLPLSMDRFNAYRHPGPTPYFAATSPVSPAAVSCAPGEPKR